MMRTYTEPIKASRVITPHVLNNRTWLIPKSVEFVVSVVRTLGMTFDLGIVCAPVENFLKMIYCKYVDDAEWLRSRKVTMTLQWLCFECHYYTNNLLFFCKFSVNYYFCKDISKNDCAPAGDQTRSISTEDFMPPTTARMQQTGPPQLTQSVQTCSPCRSQHHVATFAETSGCSARHTSRDRRTTWR